MQLLEYEMLTTDPCSAGGVFILSGNGKIELNNTLEERLRMLETEALPVMRSTLFGENDNRKFKD
jgi:V-type H+-transporting ATPase subunit E